MRMYIKRRAAMQMVTTLLINREEVGWYGKVSKLEDDNFVLEEIKLYPQLVTAAHISLNEPEYMKWNDNLDDEWYNNRRFHGHSHVYMAPSPSGTDEADRAKIRANMQDGDYYIFMIINKNLEFTCSAYFYGSSEPVEVDVLWPNEIGEMVDQTDEMVDHEIFAPYPNKYILEEAEYEFD